METVTDTWSKVRQVSLVGMNSSKSEISSGVAGPELSLMVSEKKVSQDNVFFY